MRYKINNLLELIKSNTSIEDIKQDLNISNKELLYGLKLLKARGIIIDKKIMLSSPNYLEIKPPFLNVPQGAKIYTKQDEKYARVFVISDLHMFSNKDSIESIDKVYDYCIKNGINIILICGDLIDSIEHDDKINVEKQGDEFIKTYPYDKNITNISLMGNHEFLYYLKTGIDFNEKLNSERIDFKSLGYRNGYVYLKNDYINLFHRVDNCFSTITSEISPRISFHGHSHICSYNNNAIYVPSLSYNDTYHKKNFLFRPMGLDVVFDFKQDGTIAKAIIDQLLIDDNMFIINENIVYGNYTPFNNNIIEHDTGEIIRTL